jgi:hypothetical protein
LEEKKFPYSMAVNMGAKIIPIAIAATIIKPIRRMVLNPWVKDEPGEITPITMYIRPPTAKMMKLQLYNLKEKGCHIKPSPSKIMTMQNHIIHLLKLEFLNTISLSYGSKS